MLNIRQPVDLKTNTYFRDPHRKDKAASLGLGSGQCPPRSLVEHNAIELFRDSIAGLDEYPANPLASSTLIIEQDARHMTNRLPLPVFLRSSAMCRSAFMRALSTGMSSAAFITVIAESNFRHTQRPHPRIRR